MDFNKILESFNSSQHELKRRTYSGQASNGLVKVVLDFDGKLKDLQIKPEILNPEDCDLITDLIKIAFNDANQKLIEESNKQLQSLTKGLKF